MSIDWLLRLASTALLLFALLCCAFGVDVGEDFEVYVVEGPSLFARNTHLVMIITFTPRSVPCEAAQLDVCVSRERYCDVSGSCHPRENLIDRDWLQREVCDMLGVAECDQRSNGFCVPKLDLKGQLEDFCGVADAFEESRCLNQDYHSCVAPLGGRTLCDFNFLECRPKRQGTTKVAGQAEQLRGVSGFKFLKVPEIEIRGCGGVQFRRRRLFHRAGVLTILEKTVDLTKENRVRYDDIPPIVLEDLAQWYNLAAPDPLSSDVDLRPDVFKPRLFNDQRATSTEVHDIVNEWKPQEKDYTRRVRFVNNENVGGTGGTTLIETGSKLRGALLHRLSLEHDEASSSCRVCCLLEDVKSVLPLTECLEKHLESKGEELEFDEQFTGTLNGKRVELYHNDVENCNSPTPKPAPQPGFPFIPRIHRPISSKEDPSSDTDIHMILVSWYCNSDAVDRHKLYVATAFAKLAVEAILLYLVGIPVSSPKVLLQLGTDSEQQPLTSSYGPPDASIIQWTLFFMQLATLSESEVMNPKTAICVQAFYRGSSSADVNRILTLHPVSARERQVVRDIFVSSSFVKPELLQTFGAFQALDVDLQPALLRFRLETDFKMSEAYVDKAVAFLLARRGLLDSASRWRSLLDGKYFNLVENRKEADQPKELYGAACGSLRLDKDTIVDDVCFGLGSYGLLSTSYDAWMFTINGVRSTDGSFVLVTRDHQLVELTRSDLGDSNTHIVLRKLKSSAKTCDLSKTNAANQARVCHLLPGCIFVDEIAGCRPLPEDNRFDTFNFGKSNNPEACNALRGYVWYKKRADKPEGCYPIQECNLKAVKDPEQNNAGKCPVESSCIWSSDEKVGCFQVEDCDISRAGGNNDKIVCEEIAKDKGGNRCEFVDGFGCFTAKAASQIRSVDVQSMRCQGKVSDVPAAFTFAFSEIICMYECQREEYCSCFVFDSFICKLYN